MHVALNDVTFDRGSFSLVASDVFPEGRHLVSGPIGSGKSTLALLMAGILSPSGGEASLCGIKRRMLSMQFPEHHVTGHTVQEEISSWGLDTDHIEDITGYKGWEKRRVLSLSRGELKRLHLSCILGRNWDLLILDEPFSSLDCTRKKEFSSRIEEITEGITIIFTHEQAFLPEVDYLWEMRGGLLSDLGPVQSAMHRWKDAPAYLSFALSMGAKPRNITLKEVREALCRIQE